MYKSKVIRWGNSQAISIPKALQEDLNLNIGDRLRVTLTEDHKIIIENDIELNARLRGNSDNEQSE